MIRKYPINIRLERYDTTLSDRYSINCISEYAEVKNNPTSGIIEPLASDISM